MDNEVNGRRQRQLAGFGMVPGWVIRRATDRAVHLYAYLAWRGRNGRAFPSRKTIAGDLGWSLSKVSRAIAEAREGRLIRTQLRGPGRSMAFELLEPDMQASEPENGTQSRDCQPNLANRDCDEEASPAPISIPAEVDRPVTHGASKKPLPWLKDIADADLTDAGRTEQLFQRAIAEGLAESSEAGRLRFFALVEHALRKGDDQPALLAKLLGDGQAKLDHQRPFISGQEEDAARRRIQALCDGRFELQLTD